MRSFGFSSDEEECLLGYLAGGGQRILLEPKSMLSEHPKFIGLDGQKMSKSYNNTIALREAPASITQKLKVMPTDPARVRRTDPGTPEKCPVWQWHQVYSNAEEKEWVQIGCRQAKIGCLDCKKVVIDKVLAEQEPMLARVAPYVGRQDVLQDIAAQGAKAARAVARETLESVKEAMGLVL